MVGIGQEAPDERAPVIDFPVPDQAFPQAEMAANQLKDGPCEGQGTEVRGQPILEKCDPHNTAHLSEILLTPFPAKHDNGNVLTFRHLSKSTCDGHHP